MIGYELPATVTVDGKDYPITNRGDFRMVLDCFAALTDEDIPKGFRIEDALIIFYEDINSPDDIREVFGANTEEAILQMYNFFNCNQPEIGTKVKHNLIDWEQDAQMVCAAVNNVAQTEIRSEPFVHWFTFMGYYISVGESVLATVIGIRDKIVRGKKLEKHEREFKNENPHYFTNRKAMAEQEALDEWLQNNWGK